MARIIQDEEERNRRIETVGNLFLLTGYSYRRLSEYLSKNYFKISFVTVKDYLERYIKMNPDKCDEINTIIKENTTVNFKNNEGIKNRIYKEADLIESGFSIQEIASSLFISPSVISRDMALRLSVLDPERSEKILEILRENSFSNLNNVTKNEDSDVRGEKK
mgnify:FL=1